MFLSHQLAADVNTLLDALIAAHRELAMLYENGDEDDPAKEHSDEADSLERELDAAMASLVMQKHALDPESA